MHDDIQTFQDLRQSVIHELQVLNHARNCRHTHYLTLR